ncbi:MAG: hypothetical protein HUJ25_06730 [Crocinitomicaceae bacterium]|nr:hypothetical protein [Crocinitomicaceae bacterium]
MKEDKHTFEKFQFILKTALQPVDEWDDFYTPRSEIFSDNSTKFQVAFSAYALYVYAHIFTDYRKDCERGIDHLIQKMIHEKSWSYWKKISRSADPVSHGNAMYSGHLLLMLGLYQKLSGDNKYCDAFRFELGGQENLDYNYHQLADSVFEQMKENEFHGIPCQFGLVFVQCTNWGAIGLTIYDQLFNTNHSSVIPLWLNWMKEHFLVKNRNKLASGIFYEFYISKLKKMDLMSFIGLDAGGLFTLSVLDKEVASDLYEDFISTAVQIKDDHVDVKKEIMAKFLAVLLGGMLERSVTLAYVYLLMGQMNDLELSDKLKQHIDEKYPVETKGGLCYHQSDKSSVLLTSMICLGEAFSSNQEFSDFLEKN